MKVFLSVLLVLFWCSLANAQKGNVVTVEIWSGCFERVVILDGAKARIFERRELFKSTKNARPGTGEWGPWHECAPHEPGVKKFGYDNRVWPKLIDQKQVAKIFGPIHWKAFEVRRRARLSRWYNLTGNPRWGTWF